MDTETVIAPEVGAENIEKLKIGDAEYTPEEAAEFIGLGKKTREYEQKWNTKLDTVWPEYGKLTQERKTLAQERDTYKSQVEQAQQEIAQFRKENPGEKVPEDLQAELQKARELGFTFKDDIEKAGYLKKDDLEKWYQEQRANEKAVEAITSQADNLAKEFDGKDGRPRFNKKTVLAYAAAYQIKDLKAAYEDMYSDELKAWGEKETQSVQKPGMKTLSAPKGAKAPTETKMDGSNFKARLSETLWKE